MVMADLDSSTRKAKEAVLRGLLDEFAAKDPKDPVGAMGKAYAKRSCSNCYGRGVVLGVAPGAKDSDQRSVTFCACARKRMAPTVRARMMNLTQNSDRSLHDVQAEKAEGQ
jgi:hypothetical protein